MYINNVTEWAKKERITPGDFFCKYYEQCQSSRESRNLPLLQKGETCLLSYIGSEYGKGEKTRLVIVGMDHGDTISGDYHERTKGIEEWYYAKGNKFNDHYSGVIRTAAAIFGELGEYCLDHCWNEKHCKGGSRQSGSKCVLKYICQPNLVKCVSAPNRSCISTSTMKTNCSKHLLNELACLDPNIVVFHGVDALKYFSKAVDEKPSATLRPVKNSPCRHGQEILWELTNDSLLSYVFFLLHPSRGWLNSTWQTEVLPSLRLITKSNSSGLV